MNLYLREGVHVALIDQDAVILDVASDAYLCLPGAAAGLARMAAGARLVEGSLAAKLQAAGLASESPPAPVRPLPARPRRTIIHDERGRRFGLADIRSAAGALMELRAVRRQGGLSPYLTVAREAPGLSQDPARVRAAARAFWGFIPWAPFSGECLQRSALLIAYLRRCGLRADWVFAVRLWPFSAHCWVQCEDTCLNDEAERLQAFTPILCQ